MASHTGTVTLYIIIMMSVPVGAVTPRRCVTVSANRLGESELTFTVLSAPAAALRDLNRDFIGSCNSS